MALLRTVAVLGVILLHLLLGLRGFRREGVDFFTMKPFSAPLVHCTVHPFPKHTYRQIPAPSFTKRLYLEALPLFARGLTSAAKRSVPHARITIRCQTIHPPFVSFHS